MNISAIESVTSTSVQAATGATSTAKSKEVPHAPAHAAPPPPAAAPAATVSLTSVPATVKAEDRSMYLQILKSVGGNVNAAMAQLAAAEAKEAAGAAD